ncbi:MAG: hypothetical protein KAU36_03985 [candidate division Zixibacteria bacterium]|nr:hypothetical protein [candidate division Zixibacteria bacterium]
MMRVIPFLLYLWLIALHEVFLGDITAVYGVSINLTVLMVLLVALYKSELVTVWFGFLAGLVGFAGLPQSGLLGWQALLLALIGMVAYHMRQRLNLESLFSRLMLVFGGVLVHNIMLLILNPSGGFFLLLLTKALPGTVYTLVIAWLFFLVKDRRLTLEKLKSNF